MNSQLRYTLGALSLLAATSVADAQPAAPLVAVPFALSSPANTSTNEATEGLTFGWTAAPNAFGYILEINLDRSFPAGSLSFEVPASKTFLLLPDDTPLEVSKRYYWRVCATSNAAIKTCSGTAVTFAQGSPFEFTTRRQLFGALEARGLSLQKAVEGDAADEGAELGFLRTVGRSTVYTAEFAVIFDKRFNALPFQASIEGNVTSEESESPDAWRYRVGILGQVFVNTDRTIQSFRYSLSAKYETSQDLDTRKFMSSNLLTINSRALAIGVATGTISDIVQFRWRPWLGVEAGKTVEVGDSTETDSIVLRLVPQVHADLFLQFLRRALNLQRVVLFADNTFYALPLESSETHYNYFQSGLDFEFTDNLGFGLRYKNGNAAPKFKDVHTFGGTFTIKFGG